MLNVRSILLVDTEQSVSRILEEQFAIAEEFAFQAVSTLADGILALASTRFDLVLATFSHEQPFADFVNTVRDRGYQAPLLALCALEDVTCNQPGVNETLARPFRMSRLITRIRAHLRQHEASEDTSIPISTFSFRPGARLLVSNDGLPQKLTEKEVAILHYLHRMAGKPVSRDVLLAEVWGYNTNVTTHTLETHIYRLRQKLENDPSNASVLVTDAGGYKLLSSEI